MIVFDNERFGDVATLFGILYVLFEKNAQKKGVVNCYRHQAVDYKRLSEFRNRG